MEDFDPPRYEKSRILLAALVEMCETMEHQNWGIKSPEQWQTEAYKQARAAIAKASEQQ